jgi:phytoene dehydrogenase-like protein
VKKNSYDAIVVGAGPNGLAAAIRLQQKGLQVLLVEGKETIGGGMRTEEVTLPGFNHDICSAIHPLAIASPFFETLPLQKFGLEYIHPEILAAHPFDDGTAAALFNNLSQTASALEGDEDEYLSLMQPLSNNWSTLLPDFLGPLKIPKAPISLARFGLKALQSAEGLGNKTFRTKKAKGLWAGMAAHGMLPLDKFTTAAIAMVLLGSGHQKGWPVVKGGSQGIANALASYFTSLGGEIKTDFYVTDLNQLPQSKSVLLDVTPRQLLQLAGDQLSSLYKWQLRRYRYGMGVFKMDWALNGAIPFIAEEARKAGTVHLGSTIEEISLGERETWQGKHTAKPYVLVAQQSLFDSSRAPNGKHTAWAYCHVPHGSKLDMSDVIESQIERYAPGFKKTILAKTSLNTAQLQQYNPNNIGGDINGGVLDIGQLFTRPVLRLSPYRTSAKGVYLCSSSTPPGGGVHGMCGYYAAERAFKDIF